MESLDNVLAKKGSIKHLWEVIDPENKYPYKICIEEWYRILATFMQLLMARGEKP